MADEADQSDFTDLLKEDRVVSPNCERCSSRYHGMYPHENHQTDDHPSWLRKMISKF
jgi:hypothetical protein